MATGGKDGGTVTKPLTPAQRRAFRQLQAKARASQRAATVTERKAQQQSYGPKPKRKPVPILSEHSAPMQQPTPKARAQRARAQKLVREYERHPYTQEAGFGPSAHILGQTLSDLADTAVHIPGGFYDTGKAIVKDTLAMRGGPGHGGDFSFKRSRALAKALAQGTVADVQHPLRHPGYTLLDTIALLSAGAGTAARVGAAGKAARAGELGAAAKALVTKPPVRPRLIEHGDLQVPLQPSKNQATRAGQAAHDALIRRALKRNPEGHLASYATRRLGGSLDETRRYQQAMQAVPARVLAESGKKLDRAEQAALRLTSEQVLPEEAIRFHEQQLAKGIKPKQQRHQLKLLSAVRDRGLVKLDRTRGVVIDSARHPRLAKVDEFLAQGGAERDAILERTGQMTAAGLRERANAPGLIRAGEKSSSAEAAAKRLTEIDATYNEIVDKLAAGYEAKSAKAITAGRNVRNARVHPSRRLPTVKQEARRFAEGHLTQLLEKNDHPAMQHLNRLLDEAAALREQLGVQREAGAFGSAARPGRQYVPYYNRERRPPRSAITAAPGPVVGKVQGIVPKTKTFTGRSLEQAAIPENTTGLVARQMDRAYRYANSDTFRRKIAQAGTAERRTSRDVLLNTQELKNARVPEELRTQLTGGTLTLEELSGHGHAFDAWRQRILPGVGDKFRAERDVPLGTPAPKGHVWVDRNLLGELAQQPSLGRGRVARVADKINAAQTAATVYFKLGHVPTRVGTNAVANLIQGSLNPVQMGHSARLWRALSPTDRLRALAAAGEGGFAALPANEIDAIGRVANAGAHWWSKHADAPFRFNSLAFEARKAGGYATAADFRQLLHNLQDPSRLSPGEAAKVDAIAKRANREAIAYNRLNETEKRYLRRAVWFYPWIQGSTRFAANTILEHPLKTEAMAALGREGEQTQKRELGPLPSYAQGLFKIGGTSEQPRVMDFGTVSPFTTPHEVADSLVHLNHPAEAEQLSRYLNPAARLAAGLVFHVNDRGQPSQSSTVHNALQSLLGTTWEQHLYDQIKGRHEDQSTHMYPVDTRDSLLRAAAGTEMPRTLNRDIGNERAYQEGSATRSPAERAYHEVFARRDHFYVEMKRLGHLDNGRMPKKLRDAFNVEAERQAMYAHGVAVVKAKPGTAEYHRAKLFADVGLLEKYHQLPTDEGVQILHWADGHRNDLEKLKDARRWISEHYYQADGGFLTMIAESRKYLEGKGAKGLR